MFMKAKEITNVTLTRILLMGKLKTLNAISAPKSFSRNKQVMIVTIQQSPNEQQNLQLKTFAAARKSSN